MHGYFIFHIKLFSTHQEINQLQWTHNSWKSIFFVAGSKYYRYTNRSLDEGFPKLLSQGFQGVPAYLDAAFIRGYNIYFVKKNKYWRFAPKNSPPISPSKHLPHGISGHRIVAGMTNHRNRTFLFSKDLYWSIQEDGRWLVCLSSADEKSILFQWFSRWVWTTIPSED